MRHLLSLSLSALLLVAPLQAQTVPHSPEQIRLSFAPIVQQTAPAVVNIYAQRVVAQRLSPFADDPFFGDFFRGFGEVAPRVQNSLGSGVILSEDGIVVSNFHVVGNATEIRVVLNDRREFDAEIILTDEESDLAVLQLRGAQGGDLQGLPVLEIADSDAVEVGELVLAIGNPFGVGQTVSSGIISALARTGIAVGSGRGYFIQTDAPINPGNSGGALVDMDGRLVGVNTAIISRTGASHGIGFAIPGNLVAQVVAQARAGNSTFQRPWAGVAAQAMDAALATAFGQEVPQGVVLLDLHVESPFAAAGLQRGDVVIAVDGIPVDSAPEFMFRLAARGVGAQAQLDYRRGSEPRQAVIDLILPPDTPDRAARSVSGASVLRGLSVAQINPAVIAELDLPLDAQGVVITALADMAARTGLRVGDTVLAINGTAVGSTEDVLREASAGGRNWQIDVLRGGRRVALRFRM
ncbi:MAG: trypsin-like peptidase domain-containing protein [Roseinatronobacter sp.]